jgi:hypothetical protein
MAEPYLLRPSMGILQGEYNIGCSRRGLKEQIYLTEKRLAKVYNYMSANWKKRFGIRSSH